MSDSEVTEFGDSHVEVLAVPRGSIVWLHNVGIEENDEHVLDALHRVVGHMQFAVVISNGPGVVAVLGEDEIVARVRSALDVPTEMVAQVSLCVETGAGIGGVQLSCVLPVHDGQHLDPSGTLWGGT